MKVIIDTNVLVSAVLKGRNPRIVIQFVADHPNYEWIISPEILTEYKEVLNRPKFPLTEEIRTEWLTFIEQFTTVLEVNVEVDFPRDRKDAKFLACAVVAKADFLITGDRDLTEVKTWEDTKIISVSLFKQLVIDASS
ncbi:putative nucleic acid-binding protein, contains PIN domain [Planktothrix tepida]|uniref:Predicted nucleic acid-binding protein, contains PIN domain n=2 Tax=Planktothrix TaxID=54304 RepID=A0A1J1LQ92_9CYAN|nr:MULTISPECIES: putative toxin-antitoxin system toxin component, PIN family [Planktothrix]CAD5955231.1 putative nucleic acid-binding protein, contains PIN domain [Planktothrix pseudagardhii]CAD5955298.1 putative nucleic acid-binding protein, contains PIN domain [Planktothrix tepida]CUR34178.1 Predicted nucleic acid-binding protein, contains PIN domain [Planktothrix tepida PCC 9214]